MYFFAVVSQETEKRGMRYWWKDTITIDKTEQIDILINFKGDLMEAS